VDSRERIWAIFNGEEPDRVGYTDGDFFVDTVQRWHTEGLPASVDSQGGAFNPWLNIMGHRHFGMDIWVTRANYTPKYDTIEYEAGDGWTIVKDEFGTTTKWWTTKSGSPHYLDPIVKTREDFEEKIEPLLDSDDMRRASSQQYPFKQELAEMVKRLQSEFFVAVKMTGPFEYSMNLCGGLASLLRFMAKNQDFIPHMFGCIASFLARMGESYIQAGVDGLWLSDDQGGQDRPFYSPKWYANLLKPAHREICEPFEKKGLPRILHSDGNVELMIPDFIGAGFMALQPLQNSVMDIQRLKQKYGTSLTLMGGIDTRVLSSGDFGAIEKEVVTKIRMAGRGGGYIVTCDGPVPPAISLSCYQYFVETVRKYGCYPLKC
jgi:uroporphyrinogen decarboxylase